MCGVGVMTELVNVEVLLKDRCWQEIRVEWDNGRKQAVPINSMADPKKLIAALRHLITVLEYEMEIGEI